MRLLFELGRGGMGIVYLAVAQSDVGFTKLKVIKRLRAELAVDPRAVSMFLDEARLAMRLQHPNVVHTNDVGFDGRHPFLEMEYLEGQSLDALRRKLEGAIPLDMSVWILTQVLAGLEYAHELCDLDGKPLGLVHRDVSPHNVMLTFEGAVKLLDFGIAKAVDSTLETQTGVVKGKATYMAPEQALREPVDRRADIFAVGVMLWEAIRGQRFWGEQNEFEIFLHLRERDLPASPSEPAALAAICKRALAAKAEDRYPTAAAMLADLEAYLDERRFSGGPRALAKQLVGAFGEERAAARREIDARRKSEAPLGTTTVPDVPVLREAVYEASRTVSGATGDTKLRQRTEIRGLRRIASFAIGLAVLASALVAVVAYRSGGRARPTAADAPAPGCASNRACSDKLGRPALCRRSDGACVGLETDECTLLAEPGDTDKDNALFVGAMFPLSGAQEAIGYPSARAVDLARRDFVQVARGLPSRSGDGPARPIVVVRCDDAKGAEKVARHLVNELQVASVIGFGRSDELIDLATSLFVPRRILAVPAMNSSALITSISEPAGEPRLVFRTSLSSVAVAEPVSALVANVLEPARRAELKGAPRALKVSLLRRKSASGLAVGDALFAALRFNGKSALDNQVAGDFREVSISEPADPNAEASYGAAARDLLGFLPDIVVYAGWDELTAGFFKPLEKGWPAGAPRPLYVALNSLSGAGATFYTWLGRDADLRRRFIGIAAPAYTPANTRFTMRYNQSYPDAVTTPNLSPAAAYDALYLVAYAAFAAGEEAQKGADLARAIAFVLPPGKRVDVGPTAIFDAVATLRAGQHIDLNGAGSPLDYDLATGESPADFVFVCPGRDPNGKAEPEVESGLGYSERALHGALRCP